MVFTDEELAILRENTKQIEGYLRNMMPRIRESIHIEFGDIVTRRGAYGSRVYEKEFDMWISKNDVFGGSGGLRYSFEPVEGYSCGMIDLYKDRGLGGKYMAALCNNWRSVKYEISQEIGKQEAKVANIHSFVL